MAIDADDPSGIGLSGHKHTPAPALLETGSRNTRWFPTVRSSRIATTCRILLSEQERR